MTASSKCRRQHDAPRRVAVILAVLGCLAVLPGKAAAHGPVAPVATAYRARVDSLPAGLQAKVIDGYVRIWLRVPARVTVVVLDYRGVPYVRFAATGVQVNENSTMYYLNQTPVASTPPADLRSGVAPDWKPVSGGHAYEWHDGRLQALAGVTLAPRTSYVGRWSIPLLVNGHQAAISGTLSHADSPSVAWFWPVLVLLACLPAAWRIGDRRLDARLRGGLAGAALLGTVGAGAARYLHGRPGVAPLQYGELVLVLAFALWALRRLRARDAGSFTYFAIAFVALYEGVSLLPTLLNGYVLVALGAAASRAVTVICLASGTGLLLQVFRPSASTPEARGTRSMTAAET